MRRRSKAALCEQAKRSLAPAGRVKARLPDDGLAKATVTRWFREQWPTSHLDPHIDCDYKKLTKHVQAALREALERAASLVDRLPLESTLEPAAIALRRASAAIRALWI